MDPNLVKLTAAALAGLASRDLERHGHPVPPPEEIGRRAVAMAKGAFAALEADAASNPHVNPLLHDEQRSRRGR